MDVTKLFGIICIVALVIIGLATVCGITAYGMHRVVIWFTTDAMFFVRDFFPK